MGHILEALVIQGKEEDSLEQYQRQFGVVHDEVPRVTANVDRWMDSADQLIMETREFLQGLGATALTHEVQP